MAEQNHSMLRTASGSLRVVHVDTGMGLRGGQHQLLMLAGGLRKHGHRQLIVCREGSALAKEASQEQFSVFDLPGHDPLGAHGMVQLRERLSMERPGIVHAHDGRGQTIAWLASLGMPLRRIAHRRVTFLPPTRAGGRAIHQLKYRHTCDAVIAVSQFVKLRLVECGVPERMIDVIPDGVEIPPQLPGEAARRAARERWGFTSDDFVAGCLGAATAEKGLDVTVEAARRLETKLPEARVVLAVAALDPPTHQSPPNMRFVGLPAAPPGLAEFFAGLDVYLMPSRAEGLGSSALLAMAHGVAVIASRVGGLPEIVTPGETGWLVTPGSPQALAEAIVDAAANRTRLDEFGARGRDRARLFSIENIVARTEALYARLPQTGVVLSVLDKVPLGGH